MRQNASRRNVCAIIAIFAAVVAPSCTTTDETPAPGQEPLATTSAASPAAANAAASKDPATDPATPAYALRALDRVTAGHPDLNDDIADVRAMLEAAQKTALGDKPGAQAAWFKALTLAKSGFGKMALDGWLKAYTNNLGHASDPAVLARLITAETRNGSISPYMISKGLTNDEALLPVLRSAVPQWLVTSPATPPPKGELKSKGPTPPAAAALPSEDPVLRKTAARVCKAHAEASPPWQAWSATLNIEVQAYWRALLADSCGSGATTAIQAYQQVYPRLAAQAETLAMAIEAAGRLAALQRANGMRTEAADTYSELVALWQVDGLAPTALGLDAQAQALRRIDETLWAARYRSLVGDYEQAKIFAQRALEQAKLMAVKRSQLKPAVREQLAGLRADAYHTLAYRIAVEQHQFTSALSMTLLGLDTPDLPREWQERLTWTAGLYDYLEGHAAGARKRWTGLLATTREEWLQATLKFWLARAATKLGDHEEAKRQLANLNRQHPLSFYTVVASHEAGLQDAALWSKAFGDLSSLNHDLATPRDFQLEGLRQSTELRPLLSRAEILTAAKISRFSREAVSELEQALGPPSNLSQRAPYYVYLSRLHFRAGNYLAAITLTTKLAKQIPDFWQSWPDQLLIYFARPFPAEYSYGAETSGVPREVLLGISRQESGFTTDIRSGANAVGLMQLIPPTARRFANDLGLTKEPIDELLQEPGANIRIGARYLKFLTAHFNRFPPAIYAGYNAGEYAVDLWLQRRGHSDPLAFIELIPFGETKDYVKGVWRNVLVYRELEEANLPIEQPGFDLGFAGVVGA